MAVSTVTIASFGGGVAVVMFDYDDATMKIVRVGAANSDPTRSLVITVTEPKQLTRTLLPGEVLNLSLPGGQRIDYSDGLDYHGRLRHTGVEWGATLGV